MARHPWWWLPNYKGAFEDGRLKAFASIYDFEPDSDDPFERTSLTLTHWTFAAHVGTRSTAVWVLNRTDDDAQIVRRWNQRNSLGTPSVRIPPPGSLVWRGRGALRLSTAWPPTTESVREATAKLNKLVNARLPAPVMAVHERGLARHGHPVRETDAIKEAVYRVLGREFGEILVGVARGGQERGPRTIEEAEEWIEKQSDRTGLSFGRFRVLLMVMRDASGVIWRAMRSDQARVRDAVKDMLRKAAIGTLSQDAVYGELPYFSADDRSILTGLAVIHNRNRRRVEWDLGAGSARPWAEATTMVKAAVLLGTLPQSVLEGDEFWHAVDALQPQVDAYNEREGW